MTDTADADLIARANALMSRTDDLREGLIVRDLRDRLAALAQVNEALREALRKIVSGYYTDADGYVWEFGGNEAYVIACAALKEI